METETTLIEWLMFVFQCLTLLLVAISWLAIPYVTENKRKQAEIGIWQHTAMSNAHRNIATAINGLQRCTAELASRHNCEIKDVLSKITEKELNKINCFLEQMNTELAIVYTIMPDDKYKEIRNAVELNEKINLITYFKKLLVAMRKSQIPDTNYVKPENIRDFKYFPIKNATD